MAEAPTTLAQAPNSTKAGLAQAKLRATLHHATRTLALQRAMWAPRPSYNAKVCVLFNSAIAILPSRLRPIARSIVQT